MPIAFLYIYIHTYMYVYYITHTHIYNNICPYPCVYKSIYILVLSPSASWLSVHRVPRSLGHLPQKDLPRNSFPATAREGPTVT